VQDANRAGVRVPGAGTFWAGDRLNVDVGRAPVSFLANPPLPPACLGVVLEYLVDIRPAT
jgi:hypothetical protein